MAPAKKDTEKSARTAGGKASRGFTEEEKAAMRERVQEMKAAAGKVEGGKAVLAKLAKMPAADRALGEKLHRIIMATAPDLVPRLWYGMPAYSKGDQLLCFYQDAGKFKARFGMLGFTDKAHLDEGHIWPVYYAVTELSAADEARIAELVRRAVG